MLSRQVLQLSKIASSMWELQIAFDKPSEIVPVFFNDSRKKIFIFFIIYSDAWYISHTEKFLS